MKTSFLYLIKYNLNHLRTIFHMDLLTILINPQKAKDMCCWCYRHSENITNVHEDIEIRDEYFHLQSTLGNVLNFLFPSQDLLLPQICEDCSTLLLKMFNLLQRNSMKNIMLNYLVDNLDEQTQEIDYKLICDKPKECKLKINLPTTENIMEGKKSEEIVQCEKCLMKFNSKSLLQIHIQLTHKQTNNAIICDICGKIFAKTSLLKLHLGSHRQKQCPYCFKFLKSNSHFNLHVKNHKSPVKIKRKAIYHSCSDCDYRSLNKHNLEAHINKYHLSIRPHCCQICQKSFYRKSNLDGHLLTHNKVKDLICDICGDTFVSKRTLEAHLRIHSGHKPFKCEFCEAFFITPSRRNEHMRSKHAEKNECCVVCGKMFSLKKYLNSHLKKVHDSEP